jgi:hypothetical protein
MMTGVTKSTPSKGTPMAASKKNLLVVNVLFWVVGALLHPLANLLPTGSGETPRLFAVSIPIFFLLLGFGSTYMMARALGQQKEPSGTNAEQA